MIASKFKEEDVFEFNRDYPPAWQFWGGKWWASHDPDWEYEGGAWRLVSGFMLTFSVQVL